MEQKIIEIISSALIDKAKKGASPNYVGQKIVEAIFSDDEIREKIQDQVNSTWKTYCASKDLPLSNYSIYGELANKGSVLYNLSKERHNIDDYITYTLRRRPPMKLTKETVETIEKAPSISMKELEDICEEKPEKHMSMDELEKICEEDSSPAPTTISDIMSNLEKIERESAEYEYGKITDDTYELIKEDRKNGIPEED